MTLMEGSEINLFDLTTSNLNIRANATEDVESVRLELSGERSVARTENLAPFALFGDNSGNYLAGELPVGAYNLVATPYSGNNLNGSAGTQLEINFDVISDGDGKLFVKVYPNPAVNEIQVQMTDEKIKSKMASIQIHDMQGRLIRSYDSSKIPNLGDFKIPVYSLTEGIYFMTITDNKGKVTKKSFVVNK